MKRRVHIYHSGGSISTLLTHTHKKKKKQPCMMYLFPKNRKKNLKIVMSNLYKCRQNTVTNST